MTRKKSNSLYNSDIIKTVRQTGNKFKTMMGHNYGGSYGHMGGAGLLGLITWLIVTIDLILLGMWLWKLVSRK